MVLPASNPTKSYWIEAAESPLRDYRSSDDLPQETDIVIVGSGYAGASAAYWIDRVRSLSSGLSDSLLTNVTVYRKCGISTKGSAFGGQGHLRMRHWTKW